MARSNEPLFWAPFFAGAGFSALFMPAVMIITGVAVAAGWINATQLYQLILHPLTRLFLFLLISLSLFHAVHRIRFVLVDLGLKPFAGIISVLCYGSAIVGSILAAIFALTL
ncbi:MAG: hypothetical protein KatS3mg105_0825 [Gemmatales bacterium]|nr:MAG: hypothetical protein KatS3mg105_0825 [Gemmatales bacterium]